MGKSFRIYIDNADKVAKKLRKLSDIETENIISRATGFCHGQAKEMCPVDTSNLKESIHMKFKEDGKNSVGKVYTNVKYAAFVEFGTGKKGEGSYEYEDKLSEKLEYKQEAWKTGFGWTNGQVAQPYMYPALNKSIEYMMKLMGEDFKKEIDKKIR